MKRKLDIETWVRKEHFNLYSTFDEPYYGVCIRIDCTVAYHAAKEKGVSFFLYCLYRSLEAARMVEPFTYRIEEGDVFIYDRIDAGSTIARDNGTFGFIYVTYDPSFDVFIANAVKEVERVKSRNDLERPSVVNLIRYSSLPWVDFTSISHAGNSAFKDSCPKISFGKMTESKGTRTMPMSIHVHHALVDGLHVGQYIDCFQELMNKRDI